MKLLILIAQFVDFNKINTYLHKSPLSFQKISSTGGFVNSGNVTFLIPLKEELVEQTVNDLKKICRVRRSNSAKYSQEFSTISSVVKSVKVGGAYMYIINLENYFKI